MLEHLAGLVARLGDWASSFSPSRLALPALQPAPRGGPLRRPARLSAAFGRGV